MLLNLVTLKSYYTGPLVVGKPPENLGRAADADLDRALGVERARQHRLAKRPAMVEFRAIDRPHRVAMRVDVDKPERPLLPKRLQDREGDRMIATPTDTGRTPASRTRS